MSLHTPRSLFSRFLRDTVVALAIVLTCAFIAILIGTTIKQRIDLSHNRQNLSQILSQGLKAALWHYDVRAIDDTILAYEQSGQIEYARVQDQYGSTLSDRQREVTRPPDLLVPMPSEFGGIAGHLQIWWPQTQQWMNQQNLYIMAAALVLLLLVAITSSLLIRNALKRHILIPLNTMRSALLSQNSAIGQDNALSLEKHASLYATHEFNSFRQAFEQMQASLKQERARRQQAYIGQEKALARQEQSSAALIALFEVVGQTMIIIDHDGNEIACHVSRPFLPRHVGQLRAIAEDPQLMDTIVSELGFADLKAVPHTDPERRSVEFREGSSLYLASTLPLSVGHAVIVSDITTETNTQAALDEILDATKTGLALFTDEGELKSVRGAALGRLQGSMQPEGQVPEVVQQFLKDNTSTGAVEVGDRHYQLQSVVLRSGLTCISHSDVTDARQAERELQKDRNLRNMGQLTSGIAHDFNNILGVIIGNLELMNADEGQDIEEFVSEALRAAKSGASTVRHLLAYARNKTLSVQETDLDRLIEENIKLLRNAAGPGIEISWEANSNAACHIDQSMLVSAMLNLVVNARDAMEGYGRIEISTRIEVDPAQKGRFVAKIEVQDTGPGVPETLGRDIFEPYFTTKPQQLGTGLGLSMVKGFLESSGGTIDHRNNKKGALFILELPGSKLKPSRKPAAVVPAETTAAMRSRKKNAPQKRQILLLDDETALLRVTKLHLSAAGYAVQEFDNPVDALDWLNEGHHVDLLITDYAMPEMTGLELVGAIPSDMRGFPIILCSGNITEAIIGEADYLEIDQLLEKPCSLNDLASKVDEVLRLNDDEQAGPAKVLPLNEARPAE